MSGFGFSISGGKDSDPDPLKCVIRIKQIFPSGPAASSGKLCVGDVILEVNSQPVVDLKRSDVMTLLREEAEHVDLLICQPEDGTLPPLPQPLNVAHPDMLYQPLHRSTPKLNSPTSSTHPSSDLLHNHTDDEVTSCDRSEIDEAEEVSIKEVLHESFEDSQLDKEIAQLHLTDEVPEQSSTQESSNFESQVTSSYYSTDDTIKPGEFDVTMVKGDHGLGFTVAGGENTTGYFYVKDVLYDPAISDGRIQRGDRLLRVNDMDMTGLNHKQAISYLRQTPIRVNIRFSRSAVFDKTKKMESGGLLEQGEHSNSKEHLNKSSSSWGDVSLPMPDDEDNNITPDQSNYIHEKDFIHIDLLRDSANENLGFSLIQGEKGDTSALFVKTITPGSVVDLNGQLKIGDRLLQVNSQSVIGMPHNKAVAIIKNAKNKVSLVISRVHGSKANLDVSSDNYNTDSDIDSTALDEYPEIQKLQKESHLELERQENLNLLDSMSGDGFKEFIFKGQQMIDEDDNSDVDESWDAGNNSQLSFLADIKQPEQTTQEKADNIAVHNEIPANVSDTWLSSLNLLDISPNSVHYSGQQLISYVQHLKHQMEHDDPTEEYKSLRHAKLTDNCNDARLQENKGKNRYRNVLPYDSTRVRLHGQNNYINASYIQMKVNKECKKYIACQGPLPHTTGDFWRMIWQHKVKAIAMVTLDIEGGKVKCHRYWPDTIGNPFTVSDRFEVNLVKFQHLTNFDIRYIDLKDLKTEEIQQVIHCNFTNWPDHGTPSTGIPLLQFIRFLHLIHETLTSPLVVHCSAGIGRTGALITLDVALTMIAQDSKFHIQKIVTDLRRQRQGMIQTKDQYVFCYKTILEAMEIASSTT